MSTSHAKDVCSVQMPANVRIMNAIDDAVATKRDTVVFPTEIELSTETGLSKKVTVVKISVNDNDELDLVVVGPKGQRVGLPLTVTDTDESRIVSVMTTFPVV